MGNEFTIDQLSEKASKLGYDHSFLSFDQETYYSLIDWLREEHMIECAAHREYPMPTNSWKSQVTHYTHKGTQVLLDWPVKGRGELNGGTYYEALNHAIEIGIFILQNRK